MVFNLIENHRGERHPIIGEWLVDCCELRMRGRCIEAIVESGRLAVLDADGMLRDDAMGRAFRSLAERLMA